MRERRLKRGSRKEREKQILKKERSGGRLEKDSGEENLKRVSEKQEIEEERRVGNPLEDEELRVEDPPEGRVERRGRIEAVGV